MTSPSQPPPFSRRGRSALARRRTYGYAYAPAWRPSISGCNRLVDADELVSLSVSRPKSTDAASQATDGLESAESVDASLDDPNAGWSFRWLCTPSPCAIAGSSLEARLRAFGRMGANWTSASRLTFRSSELDATSIATTTSAVISPTQTPAGTERRLKGTAGSWAEPHLCWRANALSSRGWEHVGASRSARDRSLRAQGGCAMQRR